jgi:CheY-like chemotaxis protein
MSDLFQFERLKTAEANAGDAVSQGNREHVLYVDDDEPLLYLATCILERLRYRVTGCTDPTQALELFRSDSKAFDAIISDFFMPGLCGVEFARELLKIRSDIPILMTSGVVRKEDAAAIRSLGLADLILKPNTVEQLGKALDDLLKRNPATRDSLVHSSVGPAPRT